MTAEKYRRYSVLALIRPCMARISSASAGPDRAQVRDPAVGQHDVGLPVLRVVRAVGRRALPGLRGCRPAGVSPGIVRVQPVQRVDRLRVSRIARSTGISD